MREATQLAVPTVVDNVVLAMLVDADQVALFQALAGGTLYLTPSILDPYERPPFSGSPASEFAKGLYTAHRDPGDPRLAARLRLRTAFYDLQARVWQPVSISLEELRLAGRLTSATTRQAARRAKPGLKVRRIDPGEAECAAVAIHRGWRLWSDDSAIVDLVRVLYPTCEVERLCGLLVRAVEEALIPCDDAARLYNEVFKSELNLWSSLFLRCEDDIAICE